MKLIVLLIIYFNILFAEVQTISVGKIDERYKNLLSKEQLIAIIKDIETLFEQQLGFNVFDYAQGGKPIDILYMPPSKKKKRIEQNKKKLESLKKQMKKLEPLISQNDLSMDSQRVNIEREYKSLNEKIQSLNRYIENKSSLKNLSSSEYKSIKQYISKQKSSLSTIKKQLDKRKKDYNSRVNSLKRKTDKYNSLVRKYNSLVRDIERVSKSYQEIKGQTKKNIITTTTTNTKNGITHTTKETIDNVHKIEIYDFENLNLLKVILAHEIGHLVGVKHVDSSGSLMHPLIQEVQLQRLFLTHDDIKAFQNSFN